MTSVLPADPELPATAAIARDGLGPVLAGLGIRGDLDEVEVLRYRPGRRCTFRVTASGRRVVVKAFAGGAASVAGLHRALERAGLATGRGPTVPALLGFAADRQLLAMAWLDGPSLWDLVAAGEGDRAGALAAAWLQVTADLRVPGGEAYQAAAIAGQTMDAAAELAARAPALGAAASNCAAALTGWLPPTGRTGLVHGRYSPEHVLDRGDGGGVIDWDRFGSGPVELDAGQFLAWLVRAPGRRQPPDAIGRARRSFAAALRGLVDPAALGWYQAAALVALARRMVVRERRRWPERAAQLLAEAARALDGGAAR